jgi:hypothetical protein
LQDFLVKTGIGYMSYIIAHCVSPDIAPHLCWYAGSSTVNMIIVQGPDRDALEHRVIISQSRPKISRRGLEISSQAAGIIRVSRKTG